MCSAWVTTTRDGDGDGKSDGEGDGDGEEVEYENSGPIKQSLVEWAQDTQRWR